MNKSIYFILGLILAGVGTASYWALKSETPPVEPLKKEAKKVSLLTINYIPTKPGKPIEEGKFWNLTGAQSEPVEASLKSFVGKPVVLHFWATYCAPCVQELPQLDEFTMKHSDKVHVIAVALDSKDALKIRAFYETKGIKNLSIAYDKTGILARQFHTTVLPTSIFINSQGHEIGRIQGMVEWMGTAGRLLKAHLSRH
jgi:thiol-disulfide isomerase/thioredoxin